MGTVASPAAKSRPNTILVPRRYSDPPSHFFHFFGDDLDFQLDYNVYFRFSSSDMARMMSFPCDPLIMKHYLDVKIQPTMKVIHGWRDLVDGIFLDKYHKIEAYPPISFYQYAEMYQYLNSLHILDGDEDVWKNFIKPNVDMFNDLERVGRVLVTFQKIGSAYNYFNHLLHRPAFTRYTEEEWEFKDLFVPLNPNSKNALVKKFSELPMLYMTKLENYQPTHDQINLIMYRYFILSEKERLAFNGEYKGSQPFFTDSFGLFLQKFHSKLYKMIRMYQTYYDSYNKECFKDDLTFWESRCMLVFGDYFCKQMKTKFPINMQTYTSVYQQLPIPKSIAPISTPVYKHDIKLNWNYKNDLYCFPSKKWGPIPSESLMKEMIPLYQRYEGKLFIPLVEKEFSTIYNFLEKINIIPLITLQSEKHLQDTFQKPVEYPTETIEIIFNVFIFYGKQLKELTNNFTKIVTWHDPHVMVIEEKIEGDARLTAFRKKLGPLEMSKELEDKLKPLKENWISTGSWTPFSMLRGRKENSTEIDEERFSEDEQSILAFIQEYPLQNLKDPGLMGAIKNSWNNKEYKDILDTQWFCYLRWVEMNVYAKEGKEYLAPGKKMKEKGKTLLYGGDPVVNSCMDLGLLEHDENKRPWWFYQPVGFGIMLVGDLLGGGDFWKWINGKASKLFQKLIEFLKKIIKSIQDILPEITPYVFLVVAGIAGVAILANVIENKLK